MALKRLVFVAACRGVRVLGGRSFAGHCEHFPSYSLYIINLDGSRSSSRLRPSTERQASDPQPRQYLELPTSILTGLLRNHFRHSLVGATGGGPDPLIRSLSNCVTQFLFFIFTVWRPDRPATQADRALSGLSFAP
jgi:hypothetical protein